MEWDMATLQKGCQVHPVTAEYSRQHRKYTLAEGLFSPENVKIALTMNKVAPYFPNMLQLHVCILKGILTMFSLKTRAPGGLTLTWIDVSYLWCT